MGFTQNKEWGNYIPEGIINNSIKLYQNERPERVQDCASPSTATECPRVVWLNKMKIEQTNVLGWGKKQRFALGRITEDYLAKELKESGNLLWHFEDNYVGQSKKFEYGEGIERITGTPDLLLRVGKSTAIADAKTSRSDSFKWVPLDQEDIWKDPLWYKYKVQLNLYYFLCHQNEDWFKQRKLPLPDMCMLFSYALDDGLVRRELVWTPSEKDTEECLQYVRRWNMAYASETIPKCVCEKEDKVKFCPFAFEFETTKSGYRLGTKCCGDTDVAG